MILQLLFFFDKSKKHTALQKKSEEINKMMIKLSAVSIVISLTSQLLVKGESCTEFNFNNYCSNVGNNLTSSVAGTCDGSDSIGAFQCMVCPCSCASGNCGTVTYPDNDGGDEEDPIDDDKKVYTPSPTSVDDFGEADTLPPTPEPTAFPTQPPTAIEPTISPTELPCEGRCGHPSLGGGTCRAEPDADGGIACTSCNDDKFLAKGIDNNIYFGKCVTRIFCKQYKILYGNLQGKKCGCEDNKDCYYCRREASGDTCRTCRNAKYLLNGKCEDTCPPSMTMEGVGSYRRQCRQPFTCKGNRFTDEGGVKRGCFCTTPDGLKDNDCYSCEFEAGQFGQKCIGCRNGKYLNHTSHRCVDSCDSNLEVEYNTGNYGRECRAPFTCDNAQDETGGACKCSAGVGGTNCKICDWKIVDGVTQNVCTRCGSQKYLKNGKCVDDCGTMTPFGTGWQGRVCV